MSDRNASKLYKEQLRQLKIVSESSLKVKRRNSRGFRFLVLQDLTTLKTKRLFKLVDNGGRPFLVLTRAAKIPAHLQGSVRRTTMLHHTDGFALTQIILENCPIHDEKTQRIYSTFKADPNLRTNTALSPQDKQFAGARLIL